jgi:glycerophosphoryl diester phosphodiesterase
MPLIIAHRGDSAHAPENTLAAFKRAVEAGADGIEFDVRLTSDQVAVVFHDSSLERIAGREGKIANYTSAELSRMDIGTWFNRHTPKFAESAFKKEGIPTLAETLDLLKDFEGLVYIELKCKDADAQRLSKTVCEVISGSPLFPRIVVKSFKLSVIPHVKRFCPGVRTAALFAPKIKNILRKEKHLVQLAADVGADEISLHFTLATRKLMKKAAGRNLGVIIWTADNPRWVRRGLKLGLAAIITNDPARLLARRKELAAASDG